VSDTVWRYLDSLFPVSLSTSYLLRMYLKPETRCYVSNNVARSVPVHCSFKQSIICCSVMVWTRDGWGNHISSG
jgi:hypothetical protein